MFNKTVPTEDDDTFSGTSTVGKKGKWLVTINLSNFNGDGTYDIAAKIN